MRIQIAKLKKKCFTQILKRAKYFKKKSYRNNLVVTVILLCICCVFCGNLQIFIFNRNVIYITVILSESVNCNKCHLTINGLPAALIMSLNILNVY